MKGRLPFRRSRRRVLQAGLAAGAALPIQRAAGADTGPSAPLLTKTIPGTGERLPVVGLGTDNFRASARAVIQSEIKRMHELGGTVIATAAAFGDSDGLIHR